MKRMKMLDLKQETGTRLCQSKYTVQWLVDNTSVKQFDPITFSGYQRQFDRKHANKIVDYILGNGFYFPTAITCSFNGQEMDEINHLSIVDGQHRVEAFKLIKSAHPDCYEVIKDFEIPVIILMNPDLKTEIETFITINKTSKKVDTSLAYVLKNKISRDSTSDISNPAKREYLAVEVARELNTNKEYYIWNEKILFEGSIRNRYEYITLNGFVKSMRAFLGTLDTKEIISCNWDEWATEDELQKKTKTIADLVEYIWELVYKKWPELKSGNIEDARIIQGTIGFTTINRYLITRTKEYSTSSINEYRDYIKECILNDIKVPAERWEKGGIYSKFTSESGYRAIVDDLMGKGIR